MHAGADIQISSDSACILNEGGVAGGGGSAETWRGGQDLTEGKVEEEDEESGLGALLLMLSLSALF